MKYCTKCVMPDTRPGIQFNEEGICYPCVNAEKQKQVNWSQRRKKLQQLCNKYRRSDGKYDCVIPASGGKDSFFQTYIMKEEMKMHPLIIKVCDSYTPTQTGLKNLFMMCDMFDVDLFTFHLKHATLRKMTRIGFEELGILNWGVDLGIYSIPLKLAHQMNIPLIVYGENISYMYGGPYAEETYSAKTQIKNNVVRPIDMEWWKKQGISQEDIKMVMYPSETIVEQLEPVYLSYFYEWSGKKNYEHAMQHGFQDCSQEWDRKGFIENYDQIDSIGYLLHPWMKYPKFGHARVTDVCCYLIRDGIMDRETAIRLVKEYDHVLDPRVLEDFLRFTGYSYKEFYSILDRWYNPSLFKKQDGSWMPLFTVGENTEEGMYES